MSEPMTLKRGAELELEIDSLAYGGMGLARRDNFVIFVKGAIPGQTVNARIYKKRKGYAEARVKEIINESSNAVEAPCDHFGICGGCKVQNLSYDEQLKEKTALVEYGIYRYPIFYRNGRVCAAQLRTIYPRHPAPYPIPSDGVKR
jgi:23S rRNA (uracil1939-C5)-methyltransferase